MKGNKIYKTNKQITKKQHYIPRMILKRHQSIMRIPQKEGYIWQYNIEKNISLPVRIKDICKENYLYELRNNKGVDERTINCIEKLLSWYEDKWERILIKIDKQEEITDEEMMYLYILIAFQTLRTPEVLDFTTNFIMSEIDSIDLHNAQNMAKLLSLYPAEKLGSSEKGILEGVIKMLLSKKIAIFYSNKPFVLNGNRPVLFLNNSANYNLGIYFPASSKYCIALVDNPKSFYNKIPNNMVNFLNTENFNNEGRFIYSSLPLNEIIKYPIQCRWKH